MPSHARRHALPRAAIDRRDLLRRAAALSIAIPALARALPAPFAAAASRATPTPPDAAAQPDPDTSDEYRWLEDAGSEAVETYLKAENAYTDAMMAPTANLQAVLYQELMGRITQEDTTVPTTWNGYLYYQRTEQGKDYEIICRRQGSMDAPERILLDLNDFCGENLDLFGWRPSPDNRYLAYSLDQSGAGLYTLVVVEAETGIEVARIPFVRDNVWAGDSQTLFYCKQDEATRRTFALYRHTIGGNSPDTLLYNEDSDFYWLSLSTSRDLAYHFLASKFLTATEVQILRADQPDATPTMLIPRDGDYYAVDHHGDDFLIHTNTILTADDVGNFRVMAAPVADPRRDNWRVIVPERRDVVLAGFEAFAGHLVLYERENGFSQVAVRNLATGATTPIRFPDADGEEEPVFAVGPVNRGNGGENWDFAATRIRVAYSSFVTPDSVYEIDLETGAPTLLKRKEVRGGYDPRRYRTERVYAPAQGENGAQIEIPISLVSLREPPPGLPAGPRPLRLDAYGGFATSMEPVWASDIVSLLDRGVTYAIAHVRGGFERGWLWWDHGRLEHKENAFADVITCADHLIARGHTAPDRLALHGRSNGGLLAGVVANRRPDLARVIVAEAPVVDVPGLLLRAPAGRANIAEYGDPAIATYRDLQAGYSPYQNVSAHDYPAIFVTGGRNDPKVPYWIPAKWVARLRDRKTDDNTVLLRIEDAGHSGETGLSAFENKTALLYAFILTQLGLAGDIAEPPLTLAPTPPVAIQCRDVTA